MDHVVRKKLLHKTSKRAYRFAKSNMSSRRDYCTWMKDKTDITEIFYGLRSTKLENSKYKCSAMCYHTLPKASNITVHSLTFVKIQTSLYEGSITTWSSGPRSTKPSKIINNGDTICCHKLAMTNGVVPQNCANPFTILQNWHYRGLVRP